MTKTTKPLTRPLTKTEIIRRTNAANTPREIKGVVLVTVDEIVTAVHVAMHRGGFDELLSHKLVGCDLLSDMTHRVVGMRKDGTLLIEVTGDPTYALKYTVVEV